MSFYKLIADGEVIAVTDVPVWVKEGRRHLVVRCDAREAWGILSPDETQIYQIDGAPQFSAPCPMVGVADITEEEYGRLRTILDLGGTVSDPTAEVVWPVPVSEAEAESTVLQDVAERKIEALRQECQKAIMTGMESCAMSATDLNDMYGGFQDQMLCQYVRLSCLCQWVRSCTEVAQIGRITFDAEIPEEFQSEAFRELQR